MTHAVTHFHSIVQSMYLSNCIYPYSDGCVHWPSDPLSLYCSVNVLIQLYLPIFWWLRPLTQWPTFTLLFSQCTYPIVFTHILMVASTDPVTHFHSIVQSMYLSNCIYPYSDGCVHWPSDPLSLYCSVNVLIQLYLPIFWWLRPLTQWPTFLWLRSTLHKWPPLGDPAGCSAEPSPYP